MSLDVWLKAVRTVSVFEHNITHNLAFMAVEAGIYTALWRPEEIGITDASQLIAPLEEGLSLMRSDPERFKKLNPKNGWGSYDNLIDFIEEYLRACKENMDAKIKISR